MPLVLVCDEVIKALGKVLGTKTKLYLSSNNYSWQLLRELTNIHYSYWINITNNIRKVKYPRL
jgi:hypothetical protein